MKSLISWFVKNPVASNLMMFTMFAAGVFGFSNLDREFIPKVTINGMTVSSGWPGASPRDVEEQIVTRIEESIDGLDGIDYIESTAREGSYNVNVRTKLGVDYNKLLDEVQSRIDGIQNLPPNAYRPQVFRWDAREDTFYFALHGNVDRLTLQRAATDLRFEVTKLPGLQLTKQMTKIDEQVTIEISEDALRQYNLTFSEVSNAIGGSSVNLSAGTVETAAGKLQLRARSLADNAEDFRNIIVRQTPDGGAIRIRDIAQVIDGFDTAKFSAKFNGENAAIFQVASPDNTNVSLAGKSIRKFEEEINAKLPPDLTFSIWFDGSEMFDSMELIGSNAISGMILVLIILMLFLRPAVAIWVTAGIAAAFMGAIAIAPYIGITLNMISLFAFLLVIGIVVDDAIVVGESTHFHVENGISGNRGAIAGANMVVKPVFFAVVTTILMFIPFLLMTGPIQAMLGQISLVVIAVLIFSLVEAFFILPSHLRHLKPLDTNNSGKLMRLQAKIANSLVVFAKNTFRPVIAALIKFRYITLSVFVGLFAMSIMLLQAGAAPTAFIPEVEGDMIEFNARFPEGTNFERREQVRKQVSAGVKELNRNSKKEFNVDTDIIARAGTVTENRGVQGFFSLSDPADRPEISSKDVADKLEQYVGEIPDAYRVKYGVDYGPGGQNGGGLYYAVASADPDALKAAILDLKAEIESFSSVSGAWDGLESSAREIRFTLKPGAETLGIKLTDVTRQVREAFYGKEVQRLPRNGEDVRVMVRYPEEARESIDSLQQLRIRSSKGVDVPLFSVANISFEEGITRIQRRDRKRVEYTGARIRGDQTEVQKISKDIKENFLPEWEMRHPKATRIEVGQDEIELNFVEEIKLSMIAILFMMYGLLAIAFKSYAQPLLIMIAIPFALVGMIFGNIVTGVPFGMMSLFGFFAASGVAVNDNLVLIDYVNRLRAKGVGAYQALLDACVARFRPILLTSVTTFVGIMPILFETSAQAEFLKPMVVALAFGVLFDFFLTLMLVPAMYGIGVDISRFFKGIIKREKQLPLGSTYNPEIALALDDMEIG